MAAAEERKRNREGERVGLRVGEERERDRRGREMSSGTEMGKEK